MISYSKTPGETADFKLIFDHFDPPVKVNFANLSYQSLAFASI